MKADARLTPRVPPAKGQCRKLSALARGRHAPIPAEKCRPRQVATLRPTVNTPPQSRTIRRIGLGSSQTSVPPRRVIANTPYPVLVGTSFEPFMEQRPNRPVMIPAESTSIAIRLPLSVVSSQWPATAARLAARSDRYPTAGTVPPAMVFRSLPRSRFLTSRGPRDRWSSRKSPPCRCHSLGSGAESIPALLASSIPRALKSVATSSPYTPMNPNSSLIAATRCCALCPAHGRTKGANPSRSRRRSKPPASASDRCLVGAATTGGKHESEDDRKHPGRGHWHVHPIQDVDEA